jgi:hypothetical protein
MPDGNLVSPKKLRDSSSAILDMYFTMNDRQAQAAMNSLSFNGEKAENRTILGQSTPHLQKSIPQTAQF